MVTTPNVIRRVIDGAPGRSDAELIASALAGQARAWDELVDRYGRLVYAIARRTGLREADADDVHQQVFIILHRRLDTLRDVERLSAWLITTTQRECWRLGRRTQRQADAGLPPLDDEPAADIDTDLAERQQLVRQALRRLGGRCERLLTALFNAPGEPNYEAIAGDLGMKVGSIGPTRARCFRKLEKILVEMGLEPDHGDQAVDDAQNSSWNCERTTT